ncbi:MAG TPA: hypothetical protein VGJ21_11425 [Terracidiphilus sp.]|jgi:hypothetical protein
MATYQKIETVEAEQYEGPPLTVVNDQLGEQKAASGDWLLGTEKGKIRVITAKQFEEEFRPYSKTPADDELAEAKAEIVALKAQIASMEASGVAMAKTLSDSQAKTAPASDHGSRLIENSDLDDEEESIAESHKGKKGGKR